MNILLLTASFPPPLVGGSTTYLFNLVSNLPPHTVTIQTANSDPGAAAHFDSTFPQRILRRNFISHVMEAHKRSKLRRAWAYLWWPFSALWLIALNKPDLVLIGEPGGASLGARLASWLLKRPYIHVVYAEEITQASRSFFRSRYLLLGLRGAAAVVTVCDYSRDQLASLGIPSSIIHKIRPMVSRQKITVAEEELTSIRERYGLNDCAVLLTVGTLSARKGHATVIEAMPLIMARHPNLKYIIAGVGAEESRLREYASGLGDRVVFAGRVGDRELSCLYQLCDVFVMPHRMIAETGDTEGCPTVFLEASAHRKPVVGGDAGGVHDAIHHGRTGFIVDGKDSKAVGEAVCQLLCAPDLASTFGENGGNYVKELTPELAALNLLGIVNLVCARSTPGGLSD